MKIFIYQVILSSMSSAIIWNVEMPNIVIWMLGCFTGLLMAMVREIIEYKQENCVHPQMAWKSVEGGMGKICKCTDCGKIISKI